MKKPLVSFLAAGLAAWGLTSMVGRADNSQLSPERLDVVDQLGYFTPGFKEAVRDYVATKHALEKANADQTKLAHDLPDLQKQAADSQAGTAALRQELAKYEHPDETEFDALQSRMNDASAAPDDQLALAQAYVWAYPASPHESDARQYLQQVQKKIADERQARKEADAARAAARAALIQRAQARALSLREWRNFLRDMSQDDLVKFLGLPTSKSEDYWIYNGDWISDPASPRKVGLEINFNGGRVLSVDEKPAPP